jgi:ribonuclease PH
MPTHEKLLQINLQNFPMELRWDIIALMQSAKERKKGAQSTRKNQFSFVLQNLFSKIPATEKLGRRQLQVIQEILKE